MAAKGSNTETFAATATIAFAAVDELKTFIEAFFLIVYGHAFEIDQVLGVDIHAHTMIIVVSHAVLRALLLVHELQRVGQA